MKTFWLTLSITFCLAAGYAQITQVSEMEEVLHFFNDANTQTLALFDVDMVLVQPSDPAFQMANMKRFGPICKRIMHEIPADKQMLFLSLMTVCSDLVLLDPFIPPFLEQLKQKEVPAMALTANLTGAFSTVQSMEKWRTESLRLLGIDFAATAPYQNALVFQELASYRGNYSTYLNGILFVNGTVVSKGEALLAFLAKTGLSFNKVIFVDDREENLQSVASALQMLEKPLEFQGIHFTGAQKMGSKEISAEAFEARWLALAAEAKQLN